MTFKKCSVCGESAIIWDLESDGEGGHRHPGGCPTTTAKVIPLPSPKRKPTHEETAADVVETASAQGFTTPEDGSEQRYIDRRAKQPWVAHTFWWWVHNAVAHPLIALVPLRPLFCFHDWTLRKMHGK